ncbi:hypothetical protein DOTSEDRAFT_171335 [Dothistroma septosporum NZE10]|uniref:54S ribosomal protein L31, mitochondrial n=1 Tax=Dothistroma septosporum (strain NZE10 / CBS 128990) TaxID=675120 RepID=N1PTL3_DOTSN|nr:hypothetical protein DOTSEDRAFT_171335 [Dothistroma septosporum NZE10]
MFGAFRPTAPLAGGLLWKIPWRLSAPQKLRHRRRMRRVDNVVSVLDTALKRSATTSVPQRSQKSAPAPTPSGNATPSELSTTAEGQRLLHSQLNASLESQRHGRGPKRGDFVPEHSEVGNTGISVQVPSGKLLKQQAAEEKTIKLIERWKAEMPTEQEMLPRDKYTMFDKKVRGYRKGVHKLPKWTRLSQRLNPPGF